MFFLLNLSLKAIHKPMHTILHNIQKVLALIGKNAFIEHVRISTSGNLTATANHIDGSL